MKPISTPYPLAALLLLLFPLADSQGWAQESATQRFVVRVPPRVVVQAPPDAAIVHDGSSSEQSFPPQSWDVSANTPSGVTVTFRTDGPFRNQNDAARDVRLSLLARGADSVSGWNARLPVAQTDARSGEHRALVQADSRAAGPAKLDLTITFLGGPREDLPDGDYALTVTATVTSHD